MNIIQIDDLISMWENDSTIDQTDPGKEILRIPNIHAKYAKQHVLHSLAIKKCSMDYSRMKKIKWEYYTGKLNGDEETLKKYNLEPFRLTLKSDVSTYLDSDEDLQKINAKKILHEQAVELCTIILKELNNRTWQIKEYMGWEKFIQGQH